MIISSSVLILQHQQRPKSSSSSSWCYLVLSSSSIVRIDSVRRIGEALAVTSIMIVPGSTRIELNTILPSSLSFLLVRQLYAPWLLARRIGGSPAKYEDHYHRNTHRTPSFTLGTTKRFFLLVGITMTMVTMIVVVVAVVSTFPLLSVFCFYTTLYTVTMLQLQTVHTVQTIQTNIPVINNFRRYKKERKNKNEMISHIQSAIQRQRAQ